MTLGQRIQAGRTGLGLSQEGLGERLGVSRQAVSKWEADGAVPDTDKLIALSKLFGLTLNELLAVEATAQGPKRRASFHPGQARRLVALLLLSALFLMLGITLCRMTDRMEALERRMARLQETAVPALDPAELVADWSWELRARDATRKTRLYVGLTLARSVEGLEVYFQGTGTGARYEPARVRAEEAVGGYWEGILELPQFAAPCTLCVVFRVGDVEYLQPLARFDTLTDQRASYTPLLPDGRA